MAIEVATAYVSIVPEASGFTARLRNQVGDQSDLGRRMGDSAGSGFGSSLIASAVRVAGSLAAIFAGAAIFNAGKEAVTVAADFQQTTIAFETLLGDADLAKSTLADLADFAKTTPFDLPGIAEAGQKLLAFGFDAAQIIPIMSRIGGAASALGASSYDINLVVRALGQITSKGRVQLEELNQIAEAFPGFNPIKALAEGIGVSTAEFTKNLSLPGGALTAFGLTGQEAVYLLIDAMGNLPGAAEAMEAQAKTLNGTMSTLKDTLRIIAIESLTPFLPGIAQFIRDQLPAIEAFGAQLPGLIQGGVDGVAAAFTIIGDAIATMTPYVQAFYQFVIDNQAPILTAATGVGTLAASFYTLNGAMLAIAAAQKAMAAFSAAGGLVGIIGSKLPLLLNPVGLVVVLVLALAAAGFVAYKKFEPFREVVDNVARVIRDFAIDAFERLKEILPEVGRRIADFAGTLADVAVSVAGFAVGVRDGAVAAFRAFIDLAQSVAGTVIDALTPLAVWIRDNLISTIYAGLEALAAFVGFALGFAGAFLRGFKEVASTLLDIAEVVFPKIADVVVTLLGPAFRLAGAIIGTLVDIFFAFVRVVLPVFEVFARTLWEVIKFNFVLVKNIVEASLAVLRGIFQIFTGLLSGDWSKIWEGLSTIVTGVFGNLYDVVVGLLNGLRGIFVAFFQNIPEFATGVAGLIGQFFSALAGIGVALATFLAEMLTTVILPGVILWGLALGDWVVTTAIPWLVVKSAELVAWFIGFIITAAAAIAVAVLTWAVALTDWVLTTALPWVVEHSTEFLGWFIGWVGDAAAAIAEAAVDLAVAITEWVVTKAIPWIVGHNARLLASILGWIGSAASAVTGAVVAIATALVSFALDAAARIPGALEGFASAIYNWLVTLPGRVQSWVGDLSGVLYGAGRQIIAGLANGITSKVGDAASAARNAVQGAIDAATSVLRLGSPSKVFMEIGAFTGEGFAIGLAESAKMIDRAAVDMTAGIAAAANGSVAVALSAPEATSPASFGTSSFDKDTQPPVYLYLDGRQVATSIDNYHRSRR